LVSATDAVVDRVVGGAAIVDGTAVNGRMGSLETSATRSGICARIRMTLS
jgi:hypothetical protein